MMARVVTAIGRKGGKAITLPVSALWQVRAEMAPWAEPGLGIASKGTRQDARCHLTIARHRLAPFLRRPCRVKAQCD
jgi:hypothetical protein